MLVAEPIQRDEFAKCQDRQREETAKIHDKIENVKDNFTKLQRDDKKDLEAKMENSVKKVESSMNKLTLRVTVILLLAIFIQITVLFFKTGVTQNVQKVISHIDTVHAYPPEHGPSLVRGERQAEPNR